MDESLRDRLGTELAELQEPPLGDLVSGALRRGKRLRLARRARIAGSALAAVALLVAGLIFGGHLIAGKRAPSASDVPVLSLASSAPAVPTSPTTLAAMVYRFRQLSGGQVTHIAVDSGSPYSLQFYLNRNNGPGMLHFYMVTNGQLGPCAPTNSTLPCDSVTAPGGLPAQVLGNPSNCVETNSVSVNHGNGLIVTIEVATCLPWNGTANPPCNPALTAEEAIVIAADPSWGQRMSSALVAAGDAQYPSLAKP